MDKQKTILLVVVIILAGFIVVNSQTSFMEKLKAESFSEGYSNGSTEMAKYMANYILLNIITTATQCPEGGVNLPYENRTYTLHWEECLKNG